MNLVVSMQWLVNRYEKNILIAILTTNHQPLTTRKSKYDR